ncbi:hypothetical protein B0T17DRAFT_201389 [Bombardia bombarda]|uniref:Cyclochlorotine biosynthesis protein O n=1 Tax=Bombardia bombarda TaxID=252184 RepID=A0AA39X9L4_9PEZI|nr:hypothetical protein B0T17DRAFT_201389 [Bombardia bombarda]
MPSLYHSVPLDEEQQNLNGLHEKGTWRPLGLDRHVISTTASSFQKHWVWLVHAMLLSVSMTLFALSFCAKTTSPSDPGFLSQIATYSPLFPAVKYELQKFPLAPVMKDSPYAGYGPDVDRAWDAIANDNADIMITEEERIKLGLSPDSLRIQDPKTGKWGYRAGVEVFHQLHCLNLLRQVVYKDEYYGRKDLGGDVGDAEGIEDLLGHVDHCIEAIRENLMCQGDVGVFTFKLFPELADQGIEGEWPDFSINHMCRNFDSIKKWNNDHAAAWDHNA